MLMCGKKCQARFWKNHGHCSGRTLLASFRVRDCITVKEFRVSTSPRNPPQPTRKKKVGHLSQRGAFARSIHKLSSTISINLRIHIFD